MSDACTPPSRTTQVMLDIFLPGQNGDQIISEVRELVGDLVPVIMISAGAQMGAVQRCLAEAAHERFAANVKLA